MHLEKLKRNRPRLNSGPLDVEASVLTIGLWRKLLLYFKSLIIAYLEFNIELVENTLHELNFAVVNPSWM